MILFHVNPGDKIQIPSYFGDWKVKRQKFKSVVNGVSGEYIYCMQEVVQYGKF